MADRMGLRVKSSIHFVVVFFLVTLCFLCVRCFASDEANNVLDQPTAEATETTEKSEIVGTTGLDNGPWPMFRHDTLHTGRSPYKGCEVPILKWLYTTEGSFSSSPAIGSDGTIYVGSHGYNANNYLYAFNPDGSLKWRYKTGGLVYSSPAIGTDGTIYVGSTDNNFLAINPDGSLKWSSLLGGDYESLQSSPAIGSDGTIYVALQGHENYLYALNPDSSLKWKYSTDSYGSYFSSPAIDTDGTVYVGSDNEFSLYAINPDGTFKWRYQTGGYVESSPAISTDGTIYVGSYDGYLYAINSDGTFKWRYQTGSVLSSPAIDTDGTVYVGSTGYFLYAINPDGTFKWRYQTGGPVSSSPAIDTDGTIYVGSTDGYHANNYLYAVNSDGSLKWKYQTYSPLFSSPAIGSDGTIYVGSQELASDSHPHSNFYAIGLISGKGCVYGTIVDLGTLIPIANVIVSASTEDTTQTDVDGSYGLQLNPGAYDISFTKSGYQSITVPNVVVTIGQCTKLDVQLTTPGPLNITTTSLASAETGVAYNDRVRITGGTWPYTFSVASGTLPPGLTLDTSYGNISGTPTTAGSYTFAIGVTDKLNAYAEREFNIVVTAQLTITTTSPLYRGTRGTAYFNSIQATGGTQPYSFGKSSGSLPSGISLYSNGNLSGTPTTTGTFQFTVFVTDASSRTDEKAFSLEIVNPLSITTTRLNDGIVGSVYNQTLTATGGYGSYQFAVYAGSLPAGLTLNSQNGTISGTPTSATYGIVVISVSDDDGRISYKDFTINVSNPLQILTKALPHGLTAESYSEAIRLNGGLSPFTFSYTGQLPAGLTLNTSTGIISGTPTTAGYTNVSITVTDSTYPTHQSVTQNLSIHITSQLIISTSAVLPNAKMDASISPIVFVAKGGASPYTWAMVDGNMPNGITLNQETGQLSGTSTNNGDFVFAVKVTDATSTTAQKEFFWHISEPLSIETGAVSDGAKNVSYSFTFTANGGLQPYTWRLKNGTLPSGLSLNSSTGTLSGKPTAKQTSSFTIEVSDSDSSAQTADKTYIMEVLDELFIFTKTLPNGRTDEAYTATIQAQLGTPPYSWRLESGVLPTGLTIKTSPTVATLSGTPTIPGTYTFAVEVSDTGTPVKYATQQYTVAIYADVTIESTGLKTAVRGIPYSDNIEVSGGVLPYTYSLKQGGLPSGLTLNSTSGNISGTTTMVTGQSSTFTVKVTDSGSPSGSDEQEFVIYVVDPLSITTQSIQGALKGSFYQTTFEGEGGLSPYTWSIQSGSLPEGIQLDAATGILSGTPTECCTFNFTIQLTDSAPVPNTATKAFNLNVLCSPDECSTWSGVIGRYNCYVNGQSSWSEVIECYNQYASQ